jgi:hypothetical protein
MKTLLKCSYQPDEIRGIGVDVARDAIVSVSTPPGMGFTGKIVAANLKFKIFVQLKGKRGVYIIGSIF